MANTVKFPTTSTPSANSGFTLIEVMLVVVIIGLMVSAVGFNFNAERPDKKLESESARFAGIFDIAAEYGMLNNVELGLIIDKSGYQIVGYDGVRWSEIPDQPAFVFYQLPDGIEAELMFDDLPLEPELFDSQAFIEQQKELKKQRDEEALEQDSNSETEEDAEPLPQVYILSGGDITPFSIVFQFSDEFELEQAVNFKVTGLYSTPLTIEGPNFDP